MRYLSPAKDARKHAMATSPGWKSIGSTYRPALALLAIWLLIAVVDTQTGPSPTYSIVIWFSFILCFVWIFRILRRDEFGWGGEVARLLIQFVTATVLTLAYGFIGVTITINFMFLIGGPH